MFSHGSAMGTMHPSMHMHTSMPVDPGAGAPLLQDKRQMEGYSPVHQQEHIKLVRKQVEKDRRKATAWCSRKILVASVVPWLIFVGMNMLNIMLFHQHTGICVCIEVFFIVFFLSTVMISRTMQNEKKKAMIGFMAMTCCLAAFFGSLLGYYNYVHVVSRFWEYYEHRRYTNVMPDELAAAHADAAAIVFTPGTAPDITRPVGFQVGHHVYCVAPITIRGVELTTPDVQYWAAGKDCCKARSEFKCGASTEPSARAGITMRNASHYVDFERLRDAIFFRQAIEMAKASYGLTSAPEPLFMHWVKDIEAGLSDVFTKAWVNLIQMSLIYLALSVFIGYGAMSAKT
jgi:hypothetical protein